MNDLLQAALFLLPIGAGAALLAILHRDDQADEHDLTDYHTPAPVAVDEPAAPAPARVAWPPVDRKPMPPRRVRPVDPHTDVPWRPPYAELVIAQVIRRYGDSPADIAARWLREAGDKAHAEMAAR